MTNIRHKVDYFLILLGSLLIALALRDPVIGLGIWFLAIGLCRYKDEYPK